MSILILAEHDNKTLSDATLNVVDAAAKIGGDITILVAGEGCQSVADAAAQVSGVSNVMIADHSGYAQHLAEPMSDLILHMAKENDYKAILAAASTTGKNILPRVAALLDVQQISDIIAVESADTFKRPVYAGNAIATVKSNDAIKIMTVRTTGFDKVSATGGAATIAAVDYIAENTVSNFVKQELTVSERPELTSADIVISGGRGLGSGENFKIIEDLADTLGAAVGASRAAVDAGYVPNDYQVGQTGKVVAPNLYIAVGISGAIQHLAGMKDSKTIVAINKDPDAPIFQIADYGLVADLFDVVPELKDKISA